MDETARKRLIKAFQEKAVIGLHIDLHKVFRHEHKRSHLPKVQTLATGIRANGSQNIWTTVNGLNSEGISPSEYKPTFLTRPFNKIVFVKKLGFDGVTPESPDMLFSKRSDNAFTNPHLRQYIQSRNPGAILITGITFSECVPSTAMGALCDPELKGSQTPVILIPDATDITGHNAEKYFRSRIKEIWEDERKDKPDLGNWSLARTSEVSDCMQLAMAA